MTLSARRPCRIVCRTDDPRWLEYRESLLTGTKAAELVGPPLGIRPYGKNDQPDPRALWFGQQKEPMVGRALRLFGGLAIRPFPYLVASTAIPGLGASFDFLARWPTRPDAALALRTGFPAIAWDDRTALPRPGELIAVEVKCRSLDPGWKRSWSFRLPKKARWQGEAQMAVLGVRFVLWAVHIDHAEIYLGFQREDPERREMLVDAAARFLSKRP